MALHIRGNVATLADFGLLAAAKPVLARERDIQLKRKARREARQVREAQAIATAIRQEREQHFSIVLRDGRIVRPIK